jgi:hypothetical protein
LLIHVDVTEFGNIPDGGGHRFVRRQQGDKRFTPGVPKSKDCKSLTGKAFCTRSPDAHFYDAEHQLRAALG